MTTKTAKAIAATVRAIAQDSARVALLESFTAADMLNRSHKSYEAYTRIEKATETLASLLMQPATVKGVRE